MIGGLMNVGCDVRVEGIRDEAIPTIMGKYDDGAGFVRDDCGCAYCEEEEKRRGGQSPRMDQDSRHG
jgi:hypothetical protein